jgi:flavin reductase (DIM6/NTAB) family NADH-FMN oxidoreductase RutF
MTHVAMAHLTKMQKYWLVTGSVGPRPIALVTSLGPGGLCNVAPYSAFNYMGEEPPLFAIAVDHYGEESHRPGESKDTLNNILARREFVVNMVDEPILERAVHCGTDYPGHISEAEAVGFTLTPSMSVSVPRITEAPIAWECRLFKNLEFSKERSILIGEIVGMYFRDELLDEERLRVHTDRFAPVGRLGGPNYCRSKDQLRVPVPTYLPSSGKPRE